MSPSRFHLEHSSREISEWIGYFQLEPRGEERADIRIGSVVAAIYNVNRGKDTEPVSATEVALKFEHPDSEDEPSDDDIRNLERQLMAWAESHNASRAGR